MEMLRVGGFRFMPPEYSTFYGHFRPFAASSTFFITINESPPLTLRFRFTPHSLSNARLSKLLAMEGSKSGLVKELPLRIDATMEEEHNLTSNLTTEEEYTSMCNLLEEFSSISNIDKAWTFKSGSDSQAMFLISQPSLLGNKRRQFILSTHISKESRTSVNFQWAPFPVEMSGVSTIVPSPSGTKLLVIRDTENKSPTQIEIWSPSHLEKEFYIPKSVHGSIYTDGWFQGISWTSDETLVAYVADEPTPPKPTFCSQGNNKGGSMDKDLSGWKGQGDLEDDWGESYTGKRQPALFVINTNSGEVRSVKGIEKLLSVGQVVWDPSDRYLVFVGWLSETRKLGIKVCYNRPSALYAARAPSFESEANAHDHEDYSSEDMPAVNLTHQSISSAVFPRFSPDGKFLVFLSGRSSVESGAHSCTKSLHRIEWPMNAELFSSVKIVDVVPVIMSPEDGYFPGLYTPSVLSNPWLSDGCTMILPSVWGSRQVILSVNVLSAQVLRISPVDLDFSWNVLTLDGDNVFAVSSSPVDVPQIKYGYLVDKATKAEAWRWLNVSSPIFRCSEKVRSLLSTLQFSIINVPVKDVSDSLTEGARKPFEAILVSSNTKKNDMDDPLVVYLHGGPHSISLSNFSKPLAFLCSIGYNMLIVNYRGSLGFGEESLRSLTGKFGSQDVNDVLAAIDHVIDMGHTNPSKITLFGGSHGGFLTTHLIGQAPDRFVAAAVKNPVCNLALMACTADIPDWCYVGAYGSEGKNIFTEAPTAEHLTDFYSKSPISHISKVKTPTLFLLGADDRRVPYYNGLQYARALRERGVDCKIIVFPNHGHAIRRPQSDFECYVNIVMWFKSYCK